jgi:hypothetical protein
MTIPRLNSPQQLNSHLVFWIGCYYSRDCRHSTIDYLSLVDYVQQFITPRTLQPVRP